MLEKPDRDLGSMLADGMRLTVEPALAKRILQETYYTGQRRINEQHALLLGMEMEQKTFLADTQLAFGRLGEELYLLNGRHRMHAVELSGCAVRFSVVVYDVASAAELGALYCRFDTMVAKRTAAQIIAATGLADANLGNGAARLLYAATPLLMMDFERGGHAARDVKTRNVDLRVQFARGWKPAAALYQKCLDGARSRCPGRFRSVGVGAVAFATLRHHPELGETFWAYAIGNDGLHVGDPRRTLFLDLVSRPGTGGSEFDLVRIAATAWNAFFEKRPLKHIKLIDAPIRIAGTPYGTRRG